MCMGDTSFNLIKISYLKATLTVLNLFSHNFNTTDLEKSSWQFQRLSESEFPKLET